MEFFYSCQFCGCEMVGRWENLPVPSTDCSFPSAPLERPYGLISSFCTLGILTLAGGVALSPHIQVSSTFDLCSSSGTQAQAGNSFSLAAPCSLHPLRYRQQTPKILCGQRAQELNQEWDVPSVPTEQPWERACCCGCWPWRMCSSSTLYCHPVQYFIGHQHQDMLMAIYLLRQWLATQEKPCSSLESRTLSTMKLHLFPKMREGGGLVPQSSNQLLAWMESSC